MGQVNSAIDRSDFEEWFGTEAEHKQAMDEMREREERHERECLEGKRQRCACGAPSIYVHEKRGPMCAPCGYGNDWGDA